MDIFCNSTSEVSFLIGKIRFKKIFLSCVDNGNGDHAAGSTDSNVSRWGATLKKRPRIQNVMSIL